MKKLLLLLLTVLFSSGIVYAQNSDMTMMVGGYSVKIGFAEAPHVGDNSLLLEISDKNGRKVSDIPVELVFYMKEQKSETTKAVVMPMHYGKKDIAPGDSGYAAKIGFSMPGKWIIAVHFNHGGKPRLVKFNITVK